MADFLPVPFYGDTLFCVEHNGEPFTPAKPITEALGLTWVPQFRKLRDNFERWGIIIMIIPTASGMQEILCLPLRKLPAWLLSIHPNKVKPELREKLIRYQNECDDVLWKYWTGQAVPGRAEPENFALDAYCDGALDVVAKSKREQLKLVMRLTLEGKNMQEVADILNMSRVTVWRWLKKLEHLKKYRPIRMVKGEPVEVPANLLEQEEQR